LNILTPKYTQAGNKVEYDNPGEPEQTDEGRYSKVEASFLESEDMPDVSSTDHWYGLPAGSNGMGGGNASFEGECWRVFSTIGRWSFEHHVEQTWSWLKAETDTYPEYGPEGHAQARAAGNIYDDLAGYSASDVAWAEGNGDAESKVDVFLRTVDATSFLGTMNNLELNTIDGRSIGEASTNWEGCAKAEALAFASDALTLYVGPRFHSCQ
jgi:hypothetical protein